MSEFDQKQWQLGHRRAWWNWNILTLFAALFVLVWLRELFDVPFRSALLLAGVVVGVWLELPDLRQLVRELSAR